MNQRNYFLLLITQSQRASSEITSFQAEEKISSHGVKLKHRTHCDKMSSQLEEKKVLKSELDNSREDSSMESLKHSAPDKASKSIDSKSLTGTHAACTVKKDNPVLALFLFFYFV